MVINSSPTPFNTVNFRYPKKNNFVSVIIPVYRDAKGLHDTLSSLQKQTLNKSNYEVIVANDGDDIEVSRVCKEFNIKEVKITPHKGSYNARNKALEESRGEFLAFTDADVIVHEFWLEKGVSKLKEFEYVGGPVVFNNTNTKNLVQLYEKIFDFNIYESFKENHYCVTANLFTVRELITNIGGFDIRLKSGGDLEFGQRVNLIPQYRQTFLQDNAVLHPHRDYKGLLIKKKRIIGGLTDLLSYYPERYNRHSLILVDSIIYAVIPPKEYLYNVRFFLFVWYMKLIDLYLNIKYRSYGMKFFNPDSKFVRGIQLIKSRLFVQN